MKPIDFVKKYKFAAIMAESRTGLSWKANLAQAALETGWGEHAPGNNMFGVKDSDGINGNEQLLTTTEYSKSKTLKFPQILSIVWDATKKLWKYRVKDYFRKYDDPSEVFTEHANWFASRKIYAKAWAVRSSPYLFFDEIAKAGYATAPNYAESLKKVCRIIEGVR